MDITTLLFLMLGIPMLLLLGEFSRLSQRGGRKNNSERFKIIRLSPVDTIILKKRKENE
jgi:hypothetical protein